MTELHECQIGLTLSVIGGKWKGPIIWWVKDSAKGFNELKRLLPGITQRTLSGQLKDLEKDGLVSRREFNEPNFRVEYSATELCLSLMPLLDDINKWAEANGEEIKKAREVYSQKQEA